MGDKQWEHCYKSKNSIWPLFAEKEALVFESEFKSGFGFLYVQGVVAFFQKGILNP
jgi:hypothetical protein